MTADLTIDVSGAGALVDGTVKGDPASEWFATHKPWRWARSLRCWGLPRSLRPETVDLRVGQAVVQLEALGLTVEVVGGDERESDGERAERLDARDRELVDVHAERAAGLRAAGDAKWASGRRIADTIPLGQPILVGHHSEGRHRRDLARIDRLSGQAVETWNEADDRARRSSSAAGRVAAREARAAGPEFGQHNVAKGDHVRTPWGWMVVIRANAKTVTVPNIVYQGVDALDPATPGRHTCTVQWRKISAHRTADHQEDSQP